MITLIRAIVWFGDIISFLLLVRVIMSWLRMALSGNRIFSTINEFVYKLTEPLVAPVRNLMNRYVDTGMFDFSIFVTMILIELVTRVVVRLLITLI